MRDCAHFHKQAKMKGRGKGGGGIKGKAPEMSYLPWLRRSISPEREFSSPRKKQPKGNRKVPVPGKRGEGANEKLQRTCIEEGRHARSGGFLHMIFSACKNEKKVPRRSSHLEGIQGGRRGKKRGGSACRTPEIIMSREKRSGLKGGDWGPRHKPRSKAKTGRGTKIYICVAVGRVRSRQGKRRGLKSIGRKLERPDDSLSSWEL